ncbi:MAG TPA: 16S rRNA (guanine(527)-N(7))-methyltransferase RsmG [Acidobacteriaceae bacterium]|nr:16S rRNA (guanine(527)-N(7))-methyltransferase RsmG [Acidobacteriaceae bacterium]
MSHTLPAHLTPAAIARFEAYLALLVKWNSRMNLTAVRDPEQIVKRHFAEGIFAAEQLPAGAHTVLDYGSGAGLPGIPIAICRPDLAVTLAESQSRKASFLREVVRTLELRAEVWDRRVEEMAEERIFDCVTLRAVDRMAEACSSAATRLAPGGHLLVFTTESTDSVLEAIPGLQWESGTVVPGLDRAFLRLAARDA